MQQLEVCAVCVTANRLDFTRAAIADFRAQSYPNKRLVVWDTSDTGDVHAALIEDMRDREYYLHDSERLVIGQLRNRANSYACSGEGFAIPDVLLHLDSDDRNHPNRIAEQVALLQSSGADCVGYDEMLFWREPGHEPGEAWLYQNADTRYALGTSLAYWRHVWERRPFEATSIGEDDRFLRGLKVVSVSAKHTPPDEGQPRMIARIHPGNTSTAYKPEAMARETAKTDAMWKRVPEWDSYCAETMK